MSGNYKIALVVVLPVLGIAAIIFGVWRFSRTRKAKEERKEEEKPENIRISSPLPYLQDKSELEAREVNELEAGPNDESPTYELGSKERYELGGDERRKAKKYCGMHELEAKNVAEELEGHKCVLRG